MSFEEKSWESLMTLVTGLAEREHAQGTQFLYDRARLFPEDVADMLLPSVICLAQGVSRYVGMGEFGYDYKLDPESKEAFPLVAVRNIDKLAPFHRVGPFVVEVFDSYVLEHRADVARVFEAAAQSIHPDFTLERNTRVGREATAFGNQQQQGPRV